MTTLFAVIGILAVFSFITLASLVRKWKRIVGHAVSIESIWQVWMETSEISESQRNTRESLLAKLDQLNRESVHQSLLDFEASLHGEKTPMIALRRELMDSVDRRLLNMEILRLPEEVKTKLRAENSEMMQSDAQADIYIAANDLRMLLLREYAAQRFNDSIEGDWFDVYQKASRLKQKGARNFIQRTLAGNQSTVDDARYQTMTLVDHEIRTRLLQMPAGAQFPGFTSDQTDSGNGG